MSNYAFLLFITYGGYMNHLSKFCTCKNFDCPLHPTKHDKGCAPCIAKNLKLREIPNCFFNLIEDSENRNGDTFEDFAKLMIEDQKNN